MINFHNLRKAFSSMSTAEPLFFQAPGRVNLIGEHVDYSEGFVLPLAINRKTVVAAAKRNDKKVCIWSEEKQKYRDFFLDDKEPKKTGKWSDYLQGVAIALSKHFPLVGADLCVATDIPLGAGMSSSAAFEISCALALLNLAQQTLSQNALAHIGQESENKFVGLQSGMMDQLASVYGVKDHALLIDCRTENITPIALPNSISIVVADTCVKHTLASSAYNIRRQESEEAAQLFGVRTLRDVSVADFEKRKNILSEIVRKRAKHVVYENERVLNTVQALKDKNLDKIGRYMYESHISLSHDYEVSVEELNYLVECTKKFPGVYGARMTGGGFGGSIIVIVEKMQTEKLKAHLEKQYFLKFQKMPLVNEVMASQGAGPVV